MLCKDLVKRWWFLGLSLSAFVAACSADALNSQAPKSVTLTVSVAASLQDAVKAIEPVYTNRMPNVAITYNFGSSGSLQQQIEQGAPVDIFISAAPKQMNALQDKDLLLADTRQDLLKNQVVLVTSKDGTGISDFKELTGDRISKIALGNPKACQQVIMARKC